ncbi:MAG TPA: hypothetical protein V6D02_12225 [Candidatus Obscuribacterales bacterium]
MRDAKAKNDPWAEFLRSPPGVLDWPAQRYSRNGNGLSKSGNGPSGSLTMCDRSVLT